MLSVFILKNISCDGWTIITPGNGFINKKIKSHEIIFKGANECQYCLKREKMIF